MYNLVNNYPMTNFHEINLDYIIKLVRENNGLHLDVSGNQLLLKTLDGTTVSSVTVHYAETAGHADTATSAINATYATSANSASTATNATNAGHALTADSATTAGTATTATTATTAGTATEATHATTADTALNANNATHASSADYATTTGNVEHADKAIEAVSINGNNIKFTTYDNTSTEITVPFSTKASRDSSANYITQTYVANVVDNEGTLEFKNAQGNTIVSITPSSQTATEDSYGNTIADFIKAITAPSDSNYITVTHGTGIVDTLTVNYSNQAWKDTNGNVIKNFYIGSLEIVEDEETGHYNLVAYNGDTPKAELFRFELNSYKAQIADEATHATSADYATNAGTAQMATVANNALNSNNKYYYIDCYDSHDGYDSIDNPSTLVVDGIYDSEGNEIALSDITEDIFLNAYFRFRLNQNDTFYWTYTVTKSYKVGSPTSPVFFYADYNNLNYNSTGEVELYNTHLKIGVLNGAILNSEYYTHNTVIETITP